MIESIEKLFYYRVLGLYETATIIFGTSNVAELIAREIVNVQPMTGNVAQIFTLRANHDA